MSSSWWTQIHFRLPDSVGGLFYPAREVHQQASSRRSLRLNYMSLHVCTDGLQVSFIRRNDYGIFNSAIEVLQTLVVALGAGLGVWGAINLLEGYGNDNPGSKSQGMKQLMAGGGVALVGITLIPLLSGLFG